MAVTTQSTLTDLYQTHFSKNLLDHAVQALVLDQFGMPAELPKNRGSLTIRWFRPGVADASQVQTLSEGTPINTFRNVTYSYVEATLGQYGEAAKITDVVTMTGLFDALKQSISTMGDDCAEHANQIVRNVLAHQSTGLTKRYGQGLADFTALSAATKANGKIVATDVLDAVTQLRINRAKHIGAGFVGVLCPQVERDLLRDSDVLDPAKYQDKSAIAKAEVGMLHGVRWVMHTQPFIEDETEGTFDSTDDNADGLIYSTFILGKDCYGVPKLAGTQSPFKPSIIINDKPDKSDPLNQFMTAGWKSFWAAKVLNANFGINIRSKATFA
jgi:N4-gp56 family major capsid protein